MSQHQTSTTSKDEPLISVVLATYARDSLRFLDEALGDIRRQTHGNLEILVVLDGAVPDEMHQLLDRVAGEDARLRIIRNPVNQGPAGARNKGFAEARGDYIAIFDADDRSEPTRLQEQLRFLQETRSDYVGAFLRYIDDDSRQHDNKDMPVTHESIRKASLFINPINNPSGFGRAEILKEYRYDERFRKGEDYHLCARLLRDGRRLGNVPQYLHLHRLGPDFMARRNGWTWFDICVRAQSIVLGTYPWHIRPFLAVPAYLTASLRLLPGWTLTWIYRLRNAMRHR